MFRVILCVLSVPTMAFLAGCGATGPSPTSAPKIHQFAWHGVKVVYPETLELSKPDDKTLIFKGKGKGKKRFVFKTTTSAIGPSTP
ncbi:MAG: hypothetical protein ACFCD0_18660 [Gemmataceae bacterium]